MTTNNTNNDQRMAYTNLTSPICPMAYIHLATPDEYQGVATGYCTTLILDPNDPEHSAFIDRVNDAAQQSFDRHIKAVPVGRQRQYTRYTPLKDDLDKDGLPTGLLLLKVSTKKAFCIVNAAKVPMEAADTEGYRRGTTGRVKLSLKEVVFAPRCQIGVIAYLNAVQIVEPCYNGSSSSANDFDVVEVKGGAQRHAPAPKGDTNDDTGASSDYSDVPF